MAAFCARRHWNLLTAGQADGEIGAESVHGFFKRLSLIRAIGCNAWKVDEFDQYAAVAARGELGGIGKCEHWSTSDRSCGSIWRSRHILTNRSRAFASTPGVRIPHPSPFHVRTSLSEGQAKAAGRPFRETRFHLEVRVFFFLRCDAPRSLTMGAIPPERISWSE